MFSNSKIQNHSDELNFNFIDFNLISYDYKPIFLKFRSSHIPSEKTNPIQLEMLYSVPEN